MSDLSAEIARLQAEIVDLQAAIANLSAFPALYQQALQQLADKQHALTQIQSGGTNYGIGNQIGDTVYRDKIIKQFFGGAPGEDGEMLLADYLQVVIDECNQLGLHRLGLGRSQNTEHGDIPQIDLQKVYISLATDGPRIEASRLHHMSVARGQQIIRRFSHLFADRMNKQRVLPEHVRELILYQISAQAQQQITALSEIDALEPDSKIALQLVRPETALDAIVRYKRLMLLGEPGSGKSTFLRYLALLLAQRALGQSVVIPGWSQTDTCPIPLFCPLGLVASYLEQHNDANSALLQALNDVLDGANGMRAGLSYYLKQSLRRGGIILFFDGLDEIPSETDDGRHPRRQIADAIRYLLTNTLARCIITSRIISYHAGNDWQMRAEERWITRVIQPFTLGQARLFVVGWYEAISASSPYPSWEDVQVLTEQLIEALEKNVRVRELVETPLLLTMLTVLHFTNQTITDNRAQLYEECVQLLLQRWQPVRMLRTRQDGLLERLGNLPGLDIQAVREILHSFAFEAHNTPLSDDGRGLLNTNWLEGRLLRFFGRWEDNNPALKVSTFMKVVREEVGLLVAQDEMYYTFPHLALQEYLAACWIVDHRLLDLAYQRWQSQDAERWRQVLLLIAARLGKKGLKDVERDGMLWMKLLTGKRIRTETKQATHRYRDAILAAMSYVEIGGRRSFSESLLDTVTDIETPLQTAVREVLDVAHTEILTNDRIVAARVLAQVGDTRFPVNVTQWRTETEQLISVFGISARYWCYVRPGMYRIGGWHNDEPSNNVYLDAFWIARFPITFEQYALFEKSGYDDAAQFWWTDQGWRWKSTYQRRKPYVSRHRPYAVSVNEPITGITWYEATAFAAWLQTLLAGLLPLDYCVRLPTNAEWEATAYDKMMQRHPYPWGDTPPSSMHAIYADSQLEQPAPVGCCPLGTAPCGALDLGGNVWEMTSSSYNEYPMWGHASANDLHFDEDVTWRGGSYQESPLMLPYDVRSRHFPLEDMEGASFRVVIAPVVHSLEE